MFYHRSYPCSSNIFDLYVAFSYLQDVITAISQFILLADDSLQEDSLHPIVKLNMSADHPCWLQPCQKMSTLFTEV